MHSPLIKGELEGVYFFRYVDVLNRTLFQDRLIKRGFGFRSTVLLRAIYRH